MTLEAEEIVKSNHLLRDAWEHGPAWVSSYQTLVAEKRLRLLTNATRRPMLNCYGTFQHLSIRHALAPPRTSCSIIRSGHIPILPFGLLRLYSVELYPPAAGSQKAKRHLDWSGHSRRWARGSRRLPIFYRHVKVVDEGKALDLFVKRSAFNMHSSIQPALST